MTDSKNNLPGIIEHLKREFAANFPAEDALVHASRFCASMLQSKMEEILKESLGYRTPTELIELLGLINDEQKRKEEAGRPGRKRLPR